MSVATIPFLERCFYAPVTREEHQKAETCVCFRLNPDRVGVIQFQGHTLTSDFTIMHDTLPHSDPTFTLSNNGLPDELRGEWQVAISNERSTPERSTAFLKESLNALHAFYSKSLPPSEWAGAFDRALDTTGQILSEGEYKNRSRQEVFGGTGGHEDTGYILQAYSAGWPAAGRNILKGPVSVRPMISITSTGEAHLRIKGTCQGTQEDADASQPIILQWEKAAQGIVDDNFDSSCMHKGGAELGNHLHAVFKKVMDSLPSQDAKGSTGASSGGMKQRHDGRPSQKSAGKKLLGFFSR